MLARLAEHLFWAGRYLERAEQTARLLDVTVTTQLGRRDVDDTSAFRDLLDVLWLSRDFDERGEQLSPAAVIAFLVTDEDNPGSITRAVRAVRENVRSLRELVSSDVWVAVNQLYLSLEARDLGAELAQRPSEPLAFVRDRCLFVAGVADETLVRDEGWQFLTLGRVLERVEMTSRLLDVSLCRRDDASTEQATATLRAASALEAYRRVAGTVTREGALSFLLQEPAFPRSVLWSLQRAQDMLADLGQDSRDSRAARGLARVRSELAYRDLDELGGGNGDVSLRAHLEALQEAIAAVTDAVGHAFFFHLATDAQQTVASGGAIALLDEDVVAAIDPVVVQ